MKRKNKILWCGDCDFVYNSNVGFVCYVNHTGNQHKIYANAQGKCFIKIAGKRHYFKFVKWLAGWTEIKLMTKGA